MQNLFKYFILHLSGFTSGGHFTDGSGASLECLPEHPTWNKYDDQHNPYRAYIYGAELDNVGSLFRTTINDHDMPCAVCRTPFSVTHMFPGRAGCYQGWSQQYTGYLVSSYHGRSVDMEYYCLDASPETVPVTSVCCTLLKQNVAHFLALPMSKGEKLHVLFALNEIKKSMLTKSFS